jgi:hypothetical protein
MTRTRLTAARVASITLLLVAGVALGGLPSASCSARMTDRRVLVDIDLHSFLDPELRRLVRLGLKGHLTVELKLIRSRPFWFDTLVSEEKSSFELAYSKALGAYSLDGRREVPDPEHISLDRFSVRLEEPEEGGYSVEVFARLQVVTADSLADVAQWIAKGSKQKKTDAVSMNLFDTLASDLARSARTRCPAVR